MQNHLTDRQKAEFVFGLRDDAMQPWDIDKANAIAKSEGIVLTNAHMDVIHYLRTTYAKHGPVKHARTLSQALEAKFTTLGGLKYLYQLFPAGPVSQGCRLAGIPQPPDCIDTSFGVRK